VSSVDRSFALKDIDREKEKLNKLEKVKENIE